MSCAGGWLEKGSVNIRKVVDLEDLANGL